ncbi:MAG: hypothetical protein UC451_04815 [Faecalibacterium sp.]|nr:hypothetical protein [Faecalibacterium sp.]
MRAKNLALRVLSTAAMLSIVTSIAAPAFAATYYINEGSVDVTVSKDGVVTVKQGDDIYTDGLESVVIRGGTRSEGEADDRTKAGASPATQEADGSNAPTVNETEAPKSENSTGDAAPKQETTAAGERKEDTPQQEPTEEEEEEQQEPTEEKVTPELVKTKAEAPKAAQKPSAEQEEEQEEEQQEEEKEPTVPAAAPLAAAPTAQADNSSTSTPAEPTENVITIVNNFVNDAKQAFSFVLDNVNIDRSKNYSSNNSAALTVKGDGDTEIELNGNNILKGGSYHAGLEKNDRDGTGTLTIKDEKIAADGSKGSLLAVGNSDSAGIGGSSKGGNGNTSNITITGGDITAISGWYGAGIGGGDNGYGKDITITGDATVKASGYHGAGIGGGPGGGSSDGSGKVTISGHANVIAFSNAGAGIGGGTSGCADVTISEDATVFAQGYNGGTGIGTGETADPNTSTSVGNRTSIRISDRANVTAISDNIGIGSTSWRDTQTQIEITGGTINIASRSSQYPVIGVTPNDDMTLTINGSTGNTVINAYTSANKDASIGKLDSNWQLSSDTDQIQYNEDGRSKFGENGSVILKLFKKALVEKSDNSILCFDGSTALYKITSGEQYDTLHNAKWLNQWLKDNGRTSELATDTNHAWTLDTTKERVEPTLDQEGHVYYKCSVPGCKAVHDEVLPKLEESKPTPEPTPDPTPVQPEPAPVQPDTPADTQNTAKDDVSTPKLYVIDLANTQVLFDETRQNDTVTYTTKQDGASLTGSFEALEAMAADDVKTIVFQTIGTNTPGAVSRVSVDTLLQHGGETLLLTHNGTEVHLTIDGQNADSLLLQ